MQSLRVDPSSDLALPIGDRRGNWRQRRHTSSSRTSTRCGRSVSTSRSLSPTAGRPRPDLEGRHQQSRHHVGRRQEGVAAMLRVVGGGARARRRPAAAAASTVRLAAPVPPPAGAGRAALPNEQRRGRACPARNSLREGRQARPLCSQPAAGRRAACLVGGRSRRGEGLMRLRRMARREGRDFSRISRGRGKCRLETS